MTHRHASHAGSWYTDDPSTLKSQLETWISNVQQQSDVSSASDYRQEGKELRCVIAPHAGYAYSGQASAWAYYFVKDLLSRQNRRYRRVFVLGPSHHVYLDRCALSPCSVLETPIGSLSVDREMITELEQKYPRLFNTWTRRADEREHSLEMHFPYLAHIFASLRSQGSQDEHVKFVPIVVGAVSHEVENAVGRVLAEYLKSDPDTFVVVSSDFCHWGSRFQYQYLPKRHQEIYKDIESLDREGMSRIESASPDAFHEYLDRTKNTICGRHPISVLMYALQHVGKEPRIKFVHYSQSSSCQSPRDSSVSYASALVFL